MRHILLGIIWRKPAAEPAASLLRSPRQVVGTEIRKIIYIGKRKVQELRTYDIEKFYATLAKTPCGQYVHGVKQHRPCDGICPDGHLRPHAGQAPAGTDRENRIELLFPRPDPGSTPAPAKRKAGGNKNLRQGDP